MECLFKFFDELDDFIIATALCLQRLLSWKPRERRKVPRMNEIATNPTSIHGLSEQALYARAAIHKTG